jgi:hypothetical protein
MMSPVCDFDVLITVGNLFSCFTLKGSRNGEELLGDYNCPSHMTTDIVILLLDLLDSAG